MVISRVERTAFSRWLLSGLLILLCFVLSLPANVQAAEAAEDIPVVNSGFEQDLVAGKIPGWSYFSAGIPSGLSLSETVKFAGNRSLKIERTGAVAGALGAESVKLAVTAGKSYEAAVKLYIENYTGTPSLWIRWHDSLGKPLNQQATFNLAAPSLNKWLDIRVQGIAPAEAAFATVFVYASSGTTLTAYADEARFYRVADQLTVLNPGFEDPISGTSIPGWGLFPGTPTGSVSISKEEQNSGLSSLLINDTSSSNPVAVITPAISIEEDGLYEAMANVKLISGGGVILYIKFYDSSGIERGQSTVSYTGPLNIWKTLKVEGIAPANAATAKLLLYSGAATLSKAYFDDISLTKKVNDTLTLPFTYGSPVNLGKATLSGTTLGGAIGNGELYFVANGAPGTFYAVDAVTGHVNFSEQVPGTTETWAVTVGSDNKVYFSATANQSFWQYDPILQKITLIGNNLTNDFVWDLDASSDGLIYGSTYPKSKVFSYNIANGSFKDLGSMHDKEEYARGAGVTDQYLYVGIGSKKHLMRVSRTTGEKIEIPMPFTGADDFVHNISPFNGLLYITHGTSLTVVHGQTYEVIKNVANSSLEAFDGKISPPSPYNSNLLYYHNKYSHTLWTYNVGTNSVQAVAPMIKLPETGTKAVNWITLPDGTQVLAALYENGQYTLYNPTDNSIITRQVPVVKDGVNIQSLAAGPDGKLYLGGFIDGLSIFDQANQKYDMQMSNFDSPHQIEEIGFLNGKAYFGAYSGARIYRYDSNQPYNYGTLPTNNPGLIKTIPEGQDRPYAMASGDNKLFIGTVPGYGSLGGSLTTYDESANTWTSTRNVVQDQSIIALAYNNGVVFGGTSIEGGLGSKPTATSAKLFKWDVATATKLDEFVPVIPGLTSPRLLGGLSFGPDGMLWGGAWGSDEEGGHIYAIYALDPDTNKVMKSKLFYPKASGGSPWRAFYLRWGQDGLLYTNIARYLTVVDPISMKSRKLVETSTNLVDLGVDGSIYYASGPNLYKLPVPLAQASITMAKVKLEQGQTEPVVPSGILANGLPAIMAGSTVSLTSSDPTVVSAVYGQVKALKPGTANVYADISLGGKTVRTNIIGVTVYQGTSLTLDTVSKATYSDTANLRARLTNLQGQPLENRSVQFSVGGEVKGNATTNADGVAAFSYLVSQEAPENAEEAVYDIRAVFQGEPNLFIGASERKSSLTVKRETASVAYSGSTAVSEGIVNLSAHVSQEDDQELGSIARLPIQFTISKMKPDATLEAYQTPVIQNVYETDVSGNVTTNVQLPAGLYQVKTGLLTNSRYVAAESEAILAVHSPSDNGLEVGGWFAIAEGNDELGSVAKKVHIEAVWGLDTESTQRILKIHVEPKGLNLELDEIHWLVTTSDSVFLQGQAKDKNGVSYTIRLMIGQQQQVVSLQIWQGMNTQSIPFYEALGQKWFGSTIIL
ncbi:hypothetical protein [Paenibacillus sp. 22594]|uniref:hypothetical protein n=1 Tax=Paenibacillus sp. 22594 TaxID=3453947 RepID=UPI003F850912